jgi:type IV secretion system protein VirB8
MISRKKEETSKVKGAIQKAVSYELTIADMAKRSEKRAWQVAMGAIVLSLVLAGSYFMLLPLKEKTPFLVLVDPYSGDVQASRLVPSVLDKAITGSEAISRANVQRFVLARESYDWSTLSGRYGDWQTAYLLASSEVGAQIRSDYALRNPGSPINLYGKTDAVRIQLLSTTIVGNGIGSNTGTATVRFQRSLLDKKSGASKFLDNKLATLTFKYNNNLRLDENQRVVNPLGFQVLSYKVDNDYVATPPSVTSGTADPDASATGSAEMSVPSPGSSQAPDASGAVNSESSQVGNGEAQ